MRVLLHMGSHKTGSTAIQKFAGTNRSRLLAAGVLYPTVAVAGHQESSSHLPVVSGMYHLAGPHDLTEDQVSAFFGTARDQAREHGCDVLLSAENIFRLTADERSDLYGRVRAEFPGFTVVPVIVLRRQDNLADSLFRTVVRGQVNRVKVPPTFEEFLSTRAPLFDYAGIVRSSAAGLGTEPILLPYAGQLREDAVPAFFDHLGVDITGSSPLATRINLSYDLVDCGVKRILHDLNVSPLTFRRYERYASAAPVRTDFSSFTRHGREALLARHRPGNDQLCRDHPGLAVALDPSAPADFPRAPDEMAEQAVRTRLFAFLEHLEEVRRRAAQQAAAATEPPVGG